LTKLFEILHPLSLREVLLADTNLSYMLLDTKSCF